MSGIFVSSDMEHTDDLASIARDLTWKPDSWQREFRTPDYCAVISRLDRVDLWAPAFDRKSKTTVILIGRIALSDQEWGKAEILPHEGGIACRHILESFLQNGDQCVRDLNGAYGILILGKSASGMTIITDRGGFYPLYVTHQNRQISICSHTDILAKWALSTVEYDYVTMAEFLARRPEHPHTYYSDIKQLDPACIYTSTSVQCLTQNQYWSAQVDIHSDISRGELSRQLAGALTAAVDRRTARHLGLSGLLLSAGVDSRAILFASSDPAEILSITLFDEENEELRIAREIALRTGSQHMAVKREFEHYTASAEQSIRITGGMGRIYDAHFTGCFDSLWASGVENLLSGCYADALFKSALIANRFKTLFGKALPIRELASSTYSASRIHHAIAEKWKGYINARIFDSYRDSDLSDTSDVGLTRIAIARAFPISRVVPGSLMHMLRALPWDPLMADTDLLNLSLSIPASMRLNGQVWEGAVRLLRPDLVNIQNNNNRSHVGASQTEILAKFFFGVAYRKIFNRDFGKTPLSGYVTRGSWPEFSYLLLHSKVIPRLWAQTVEPADILSNLLGFDPWSLSLEEWAERDTEQFYRLLTLKVWLDQQYNRTAV